MKVALVADDNLVLRRQVIEVLMNYGFEEVFEADTGRQAVDISLIRKPGLIILGNVLPVMDGVTAAEKISKKLTVPMVLLTTDDVARQMDRIRRAGVTGCVHKPFHDAQLYATIDMAIHKSAEISHLREEVAKLKDTLESRKLIERAKGMLIRQGFSEPEAYRRMQKVSMDKRKTLREVAEAILLMEG